MINKGELYFAVAKKLVEEIPHDGAGFYYAESPAPGGWSGYVDAGLESVVKTAVDAVLDELGKEPQ